MRYLRWLGRLLWFPIGFAWAVVRANVEVGIDIVTPASAISGGFIEVPLRCETDLEIAVLANMVTLTPGTAAVALYRPEPTLWIQGLYMDSPESLRRDVYHLEDMLLGVTRVSGAPHDHPRVGNWRKEQVR